MRNHFIFLLRYIKNKVMRKIFIIFSAIVMMAGFTMTAMAQTSATVSATAAGSKLVVPMTLTQTSPLHFGSITLLDATGGTVVLPSNSTTRIFDAGVSESLIAPLATNAAYSVTGSNSSTYALTLPTTVIVTETVGSTATMTISALTARFNLAVEDAVVSTLSAGGTDNFTLGGTLTVTAAQIGGIYAGTFPVTVDYN